MLLTAFSQVPPSRRFAQWWCAAAAAPEVARELYCLAVARPRNCVLLLGIVGCMIGRGRWS